MDFSAYTRFHALAQDRRSCRNYLPQPVDRSLLLAILDAARLSPSAVNRQPVRYIVLDAEADPEVRDIILKVYNRPWIATAPVYIVAVGMHNQAWHRPCDGKDHADIDVAIARRTHILSGSLGPRSGQLLGVQLRGFRTAPAAAAGQRRRTRCDNPRRLSRRRRCSAPRTKITR